MSNKIVPNVSVTKYEGGEEAVFKQGSNVVSVARSDAGLFDVLKSGENTPRYTGTDQDQASAATQKALKD